MSCAQFFVDGMKALLEINYRTKSECVLQFTRWLYQMQTCNCTFCRSWITALLVYLMQCVDENMFRIFFNTLSTSQRNTLTKGARKSRAVDPPPQYKVSVDLQKIFSRFCKVSTVWDQTPSPVRGSFQRESTSVRFDSDPLPRPSGDFQNTQSTTASSRGSGSYHPYRSV